MKIQFKHLSFILSTLLLASCGFLKSPFETSSSSSQVATSSTVNSTSSSQGQSNSHSEDSFNPNRDENIDHVHEDVIYDNLQIHFLELGNQYTGDAVYIKAGDTDILIDAGSRGNSATTLTSYIDKYCTDGKLEYVISTHAHQDHISGFAGNSSSKATNFFGEVTGRTGIMYYYNVGTLIDFSFFNSSKKNGWDNKTATLDDFSDATEYGKYMRARNYAIEKGTTWYTAGDCFNNENGAQQSYVVNEEFNISIDILYNKFYYNSTSDDNNYSVCTMLNYNGHHFMFTGDLEESGEKSLVTYYDKSNSSRTLPKCDLYKGGHHGSRTSSSDALLDMIDPDICAVCCCAGGSEYTNQAANTFPTQDFINRIAKHTDRVYVTSVIDEKLSKANSALTQKSLNGNIIVSAAGDNVGVKCTVSNTKLKDSEWFSETIYIDSNGLMCSGKAKTDFYDENSEGVTPSPRRIWPSLS